MSNTANTLVHLDQGGSTLTVESGGVINVLAGGAIQSAGISNLRVVAGEVTLDGSNPTPVVTGLTAITAFIAVLKKTTSPALDPTQITVDYTGGTANIYAWKVTATGDATLIASTNSTAVYSWIAVGT